MDIVVLGALIRPGEVLLAHRRPDKRAYPDVWDLPGGLVETGETELEALTRELEEELDVRITDSSTIHLHRLTATGPDGRVVISGWLVGDWQGAPENAAPKEHDEIAWFNLEELPPPVHSSLRTSLLRAVKNLPA